MIETFAAMAATLVASTMCCARIATAQGAADFDGASARTSTGAAFILGPPKTGGPAIVRASFQLRDLNDVDEEAETFEFEGVLTLSWRDERQAFDPAALGVDEKIYQGDYQFNEVFDGWFPQVILVNESGLYENSGVLLRVQPDGRLTLVATLNAAVETDLDLRRHPFDRQRVEAIFEVLGFDETEVELQAEPSTSGASASPPSSVNLPQWKITDVQTFIRDRRASHHGESGVASTFVLSVELERQSFFMLRLVVLPLVLVVMLSWSVFWMDRSSLGDRLSVSFIGILTAVAYQIVVSEILPQISYVTLMNGFLNVSFIVMCASVVINLVVGSLDRSGRSATGDLIDRRCRWIFPLTYFGLVLLVVAAAFILFPDPRPGV